MITRRQLSMIVGENPFTINEQRRNKNGVIQWDTTHHYYEENRQKWLCRCMFCCRQHVLANEKRYCMDVSLYEIRVSLSILDEKRSSRKYWRKEKGKDNLIKHIAYDEVYWSERIVEPLLLPWSNLKNESEYMAVFGVYCYLADTRSRRFCSHDNWLIRLGNRYKTTE